jgi:secreted Zn-dependent insulinase-like peptidase
LHDRQTAAQSDGLHLPRPNPFICEDFEVLAKEFEPPSAVPSPPTLSRASSFLQLWYKQDRSFKVGLRLDTRVLDFIL